MSLRIFCDQCIPLDVADWLRAAGHQVIALRDSLPIRSPDPQVIAKAQELDCILLTLNGDFSDIVAYPPGKYNGVLALQLHNHPELIPQLMKRLDSFIEGHPSQIFYRGKLFIVEVHRIRIRN